MHVANLNGCTPNQGKNPDAGFKILSDPRVFPHIVVEIAYRNESHRVLFEEGGMWLNVVSDTQYALLIKIHPDCAKMEIYFCERAQVVKKEYYVCIWNVLFLFFNIIFLFFPLHFFHTSYSSGFN